VRSVLLRGSGGELFEVGTRAPEDSEEDGEAGVEPKEAVEQARLDMPHGPAHSRSSGRVALPSAARRWVKTGGRRRCLALCLSLPLMLLMQMLVCPVLVPLLSEVFVPTRAARRINGMQRANYGESETLAREP